MAVTFGMMAQVASQSALAVGQAQASNQGLGQSEGNALAVTNMLQNQGESTNLVQSLMGGKGSGKSHLRGQGLTNDLMDIGQAALVQKRGGIGNSLGLGGDDEGGTGTLLSLTI